MTDCSNAEIRDLLPEYLAGTLAVARRAEVEAHVAACTDCAAEIEVLRLVREAWAEAASPAVNVGAIVAALPKARRRPAVRSWRQNHAFQIAAAVSFIALGGMSLAVARSFFTADPAAAIADSAGGVDTMSAAGDATPAISFAGGVSDLADDELEALLTALESIEALPVTEPAELPLVGSGREGT